MFDPIHPVELKGSSDFTGATVIASGIFIGHITIQPNEVRRATPRFHHLVFDSAPRIDQREVARLTIGDKLGQNYVSGCPGGKGKFAKASSRPNLVLAGTIKTVYALRTIL